VGRAGLLPPQNLYAAAMYSRIFGDARQLAEECAGKLGRSRLVANMPYRLNTQIAGHIGLLRLAQMSGKPTRAVEELEKALTRLLILRIALSKNPASLRQSGFEYGGYQ